MDFDKLGGRKFVSTVIILIIGAGMQAAGRFTTEFGVFLASVLAVFSGANSYLSAKTAGLAPAAASAPEQEDVEAPELAAPPVNASLTDSDRALLEQIAVTVGQTQQILINAMQAGKGT